MAKFVVVADDVTVVMEQTSTNGALSVTRQTVSSVWGCLVRKFGADYGECLAKESTGSLPSVAFRIRLFGLQTLGL